LLSRDRRGHWLLWGILGGRLSNPSRSRCRREKAQARDQARAHEQKSSAGSTAPRALVRPACARLSQKLAACEGLGVVSDAVDDGRLLMAAARGEQAAFEAFYRRWLPQVVGFHLRRVGVPEVAFDLTAETFAAVVSGCGRFDPERGPAAGWLFAIAEHKLADSLRRARVESSARTRLGLERVILEDADLARVDDLASLADRERLMLLLGELSAEQQAAISARVLDERPYEAIARELSCSEAVVRQRVHRGLRRLRKRLEETA